jgi:DNA gyrase subunit A
LLPLAKDEVITNIMPLPEDKEEWDTLNIMFATAKGNVRRNDMSDFKRIQSNGKIAIRLDEDDKLIGVEVCGDTDHILLASKKGKAIRFPAEAVRVFKSRTSDGVRGIKLGKDDNVISMTILGGIGIDMVEREAYLSVSLEQRQSLKENPETLESFTVPENISKEKFQNMLENEQFILSISENGFGKRTTAYEYRITNRGGSGIVNMAISSKTGDVVASLPAIEQNELMLITNSGKLIRCKLNAVRTTGRSTAGVILFKTEAKEKVVSVALIADDDDEDSTEADGGNDQGPDQGE